MSQDFLLEHKFLPHCWVGGPRERFNNQVPPGPEMEHRHHLIPRACGGSDGPQVSLCDRHHAMLHKVAASVLASKPWTKHTVGCSDEELKKILWLASLVVKSTKATEHDIHKPQRITLVLNREQQHMLNLVKENLGCNRNDEVFLTLLTRAVTSLRRT